MAAKPVGSSSDREFIAAQRFIRLGYERVAFGENAIRAIFGMAPGQKCADIVVESQRGECIVAECKGSDIPHALEQLKSTLPFVKKKYSRVEPQIIRNAANPGRSMPEVAIGKGYRARFLQYSNAHVLVALNGTEVRLNTGERVLVVFDLQ